MLSLVQMGLVLSIAECPPTSRLLCYTKCNISLRASLFFSYLRICYLTFRYGVVVFQTYSSLARDLVAKKRNVWDMKWVFCGFIVIMAYCSAKFSRKLKLGNAPHPV